ncbi:uncharacterized protein METZ01_LOCUS231392, partial [marine metagenome]
MKSQLFIHTLNQMTCYPTIWRDLPP